MMGPIAIARREFASMFRLPVGWVVMALFLLLTASVFVLTIAPGQPASLRDFFAVSAWLLMPVAPAISMRLLSEEHRTGTAEPLLTSPVSEAGVVVGKYLGGWLFLLCVIAPTLVYPVVLWSISDPKPDPGPVLAGYVSLVLQGSLYLAIGTAISAMTSSQTLAYLATLFPILGLLMLSSLSPGTVPAWVEPVVAAVSIRNRATDFARGIIDTSHIVFFLVATGWCLFAAHAALESRRWR
ncbi:MAG: ABC transporter permease subunit [Phycisphaerales bacterium]|nr:ABC transporter permease subunit [Phycisphaerales bacterium]